ncbi:hypothetical protein DFJ74DRAFT_713148 [Hyaloraphidium curvatum]|nr:hypothetical protein DFJ74DRAFT_713148 [Hyaloraphidium curvatum]
MSDEELVEHLEGLETAVSEIEQHLESLLESDLADHLADLQPLESAKLTSTLAFSIATLFYVYLKTNGLNPKEHQVKGELDRIKSYFIKVATAEGSHKPTMKIDKDAAKRFLTAALKEAKRADAPE